MFLIFQSNGTNASMRNRGLTKFEMSNSIYYQQNVMFYIEAEEREGRKEIAFIL